MTVTALPPNALLAGGLSAEHVGELAAIARLVTLRESEAACQLGGDAKELFVVRSGVIELSLEAPVAGVNRRIVVEETKTGETFGWSALVPPHRYTLDAFAAVDSTVIVLDRDELLALCARVPALGNELMHNLLKTVGRRLHVLQAMWIRELRRNLERDYPAEQAEG